MVNLIVFRFFCILLFASLVQAQVPAVSKVARTLANNDTMFKDSKIVGGLRTDISFVRTQVAILEELNLICSGNIIKLDVILTVAHCTYEKNVSLLAIRSGSNFHNKDGIVVAVLRVKMHSEYTKCMLCHNDDIALLFLLNSAIVPGIPAEIIALWDAGTIFPVGTVGRLSGSGATQENGRPSGFLKIVSLPIVSRFFCAIAYGPFAIIDNFCAGYSNGGKSGCNGDSGAGLVIGRKLAGLHGFARGCARPNYPGAYTNVPKFRRWIQEEAGV